MAKLRFKEPKECLKGIFFTSFILKIYYPIKNLSVNDG